MVNSFVARQDQLRQQAQQEEQLRQQAEQVRLQNERAAAQDQLQREQFAAQRQDTQFAQGVQTAQLERQTRLDALGQREDELTKVLSPQVNSFMQGVSADLERYAPTLKDGRPNPQFNQALFMAAKARVDQVKKLWAGVSLKVGAGAGYEEAKAELMQFVGGDAPTAAPAAPTSAAPPVMDMKFAPAPPAPVSVQEPGGASFNFTPEAAPTAAPVRSDMPASITQVAPSQLMDMDDQTILATYGQGGMEYAIAARTEYAAQQEKQQAAAQKVRADGWAEQLSELAKRTDLTGEQRVALVTATELMNRRTLTPAEAQQLRDAFEMLEPQVYSAANWNALVAKGDANAIVGQYDLYAPHLPELKNFPIGTFRDQVQEAMNKTAADAAQGYAAAGNSISLTTERDALLPGALVQQGAALEATQAGTARDVAAAGASRETVRGARYDLGVKLLAQVAGTGATVYQLQQTPTWAQLKADLGVNDAVLTGLLQKGRFEYDRGLRTTDLENMLRAAQIEGENARRGLTLAQTQGEQADTQRTLTLLPGEQAQQAAQTTLTQAQTQGENADTARTLTLTPLEAADTAAGTTLKTAQTANVWADTAKVAEDIKIERQRTAAYIKSVEGGYAVDMARVDDLTQNTLLTRTKNPNDPLYNPVIANSKPGDPVDALKKKAGVFYTQADQALKQANTVQGQINALTKLGVGVTGTFDLSRLSAADQKKLTTLTAQRDALFKQAQAARQRGDTVITDGLGAATAAPQGRPGDSPFRRLPAAPGVKLGGVSTALVNRMDSMLGGFVAPGGLVPIITQGVRTKEEQDALYAQGRTAPGSIVTNAKGGQSNHEGGNAVDISWKDPKTGKILAGTDPRAQAAWKALGAIAPQYGLRWGGTFKTADGRPFVDMYHFEVFGQPTVKLTPVAAAKPAATPAGKTAAPAATAAPARPAGPAPRAAPTVTATVTMPGQKPAAPIGPQLPAPLPVSANTPRPATGLGALPSLAPRPTGIQAQSSVTVRPPTAPPAPVVKLPGGLEPVGLVGSYAGQLTKMNFFKKADGVQTAAQANALLDSAVASLLPGATADVKRALRNDLAKTLGW